MNCCKIEIKNKSGAVYIDDLWQPTLAAKLIKFNIKRFQYKKYGMALWRTAGIV